MSGTVGDAPSRASAAPSAPPPRPAAAPRGWRRGVSALLFGTHAGPWLLPLAPLTLLRVARALRAPGVSAGGGFHAFGDRDAGFRGWYRKIAADQRACGRAGYAWDDGLGLPMNPRFYNNAGTYVPYGVLGPRAYAAVSILLFMALVAGGYAMAGAPVAGVAAAVLLLASPLFLGAQLHYGKPEILWWALIVPLVLAAWRGDWLLAGAIFTVVALGNFAVAFLAGVTCVLLALLFWPGTGGVGLLALGMAPGLLKTAVRLLPFLRSGLMGALAHEQSDASGSRAGPVARLLAGARSPGFLVYAGFYLGALGLVVWAGGLGWPFAAFGAAVLGIFLAGQSAFYLNDPQSFWMWHLALLAGMSALNPSWGSVAGVLLLAYIHPRVLGYPLPEPAGSRGGLWDDAVRATRQLAAFPALDPVGRDELRAPLRELAAALSPGTRVLLEPATGDRDMAGYRTFMQLCDEELPAAGVEIAPDEYVRAYWPRLYGQVMARFGADTPAEALRETARVMGAAHVLAYTPAFVRALEAAGFARAGVLDPAGLPARTRELLRLPPAPLVLLRAPAGEGVLSPPAAVEREGNALRWEARADTSYLVRYAWHPRMRAEQGGRPLEVAAEPHAGGAVTFMRVRAQADGPVTLRFHPRWLS
ncbi:hypothetical protein [Longimicrobium sp.]|uniref:hypothetical protein n=1 Tax=Longimicrobium sp. TaxID=2029185 RepID=UPI003B3BE287